MLPKAVLSLVGRVVGIAAVVASPLIARAAPAPSKSDAHHLKEHRKATRHHAKADHKGESKAEAKADTKVEAKVEAKKRAMPVDVGHDGEPEVVIERTSVKRVPKPSTTPLPTIAANATKPLAEPIDVRHAAEPMRTPIVLSSTAPKKRAKPPCLHAPIDVTRGSESETFPLTKCDGSPAPGAVEEMSILVRPGSAAKPDEPVIALQKKAGEEIAPGIKRIDARLLDRLQAVVDHFGKDGAKTKLFVVSGYRPNSKGSFHAMGRAIDFRIEGVENTDLVTFCKTLPDTGCGFYPNSSFIHIDVRDAGTGHVSWIDTSGPGEKPTYVAQWPPPPSSDTNDDETAVKLLAKLDELQLLPTTPKTDADDDVAKPASASLAKKIDDNDDN